jgi:hypothetical protein
VILGGAGPGSPARPVLASCTALQFAEKLAVAFDFGSLLHLILGGAAVYRCDNRIIQIRL